MEKSSFFDAELIGADQYDKNYLSEDFAEYFSAFLSNGVFPNPSTGLQVVAASTPNMTVTLQPGFAFINGRRYENTAPLQFQINVADGVLNRKTAIMVRFEKLARQIKAYKIEGTPGASAVAPAPIRTEDYWDLCVAIVNVNKGISAISQSLIADTRMSGDLCGIVTNLVTTVDATTLYDQIQSDLANFKTANQAGFEAWFADINAKLGTEPATALQQQVDALNTGKMSKATYDTDGDGVVDKAKTADAAPWTGITGKPATFPPATHNHDDRYYTETEIDTKLNGKAASVHTHTKDQVGLSKVNNNAIAMSYDGNLWISFS